MGFRLQDGEYSVSVNLMGLRLAINHRRFTRLRDPAAPRFAGTTVYKIGTIRVLPRSPRPPMMRGL
jgi:hypothetical protein